MSTAQNNPPVLSASNYIDASQEIVASASLLAAAVTAALENQDIVIVDLAGLPAVPSSYFNTVLLTVLDQFGADAVRTRLRFWFSSLAQENIFERSRVAALRDFDGENDNRTLEGGINVALVRYPKEITWAIQSVSWEQFAAKTAPMVMNPNIDLQKSGWDKLRFDTRAEAYDFVAEKTRFAIRRP